MSTGCGPPASGARVCACRERLRGPVRMYIESILTHELHTCTCSASRVNGHNTESGDSPRSWGYSFLHGAVSAFAFGRYSTVLSSYYRHHFKFISKNPLFSLSKYGARLLLQIRSRREGDICGEHDYNFGERKRLHHLASKTEDKLVYKTIRDLGGWAKVSMCLIEHAFCVDREHRSSR